MSNQSSRTISSNRPVTARALALALAACAGVSASACAADEAPLPEVPPGSSLGPDELAALRTPTADEAPPPGADELAAQAQRAQAYVEASVTPRLDRALRETSGLSYAQLQSEVIAALTAAGDDAEAIRAAVDHFRARRGGAIESAVAHLGTSTTALAEEIRVAALGDKAQPPQAQPTPPQRLGACFTGFEFEPFPPFFQSGNWFVGVNSQVLPTANVNGMIHAEANLIVGGTTQVGGWVRADNIPPAGAGTTFVSTSAFFSTALSELTIWVPSYAGSGVGLSIQLFDGGPSGTFLGSCRMPILDAAIPVGYLRTNRSTVVNHSCAFHHPSSGFLTAKVHVDAYGTSLAPFGSVARAVADANIQTIRYVTCLD